MQSRRSLVSLAATLLVLAGIAASGHAAPRVVLFEEFTNYN